MTAEELEAMLRLYLDDNLPDDVKIVYFPPGHCGVDVTYTNGGGKRVKESVSTEHIMIDGEIFYVGYAPTNKLFFVEAKD